MNKRSSAAARVLAATALVAGLIVVVIALGGALGGGDGSGGSHQSKHAGTQQQHEKPKRVPATYEVKSGDTLISIAHNTGVPVATIEKLNSEVDPQILIAGEQLKLR
jgi:LysM repeat protein